ncbi:4-(cytidine 5'-diphospho)-2-C-methyl-D-erythritol kinase [Kineobactrum sediminis]|uniref:4-diphosphocytidyl-2-C-methyl-D-erythritol kinase n=1 Tax=Kineobactrum sediminis TaxID=1905677 RepID=A0A2N5Y3D6_9GAMM|nr:4-(cytidine 5'-diphospho)-2-C-methyl-D-erythritol kinase [Kineobactrum sediminis]PLW82887.1 4-(cytidine 5'-diphospho)-2-C-methyl-D-erythritol kinase [Kineobactrum sediminis]
MSPTLQLIAPAKLNLFLHITGRRSDGYHTLQTLFQLLDWGDSMSFTANTSGELHLDMAGRPLPDGDNLILRAARLLQRDGLGANIHCHKRIPIGGGLGGGSSNAATTLLALNHLWQLGLSQLQLQSLGTTLGADVPVFVGGHSAWAEGIGEQLAPVDLPTRWYLVIKPACQVHTGEIFCDSQLTRDTPPITMAAVFQGTSHNDCEAVVVRRYPEVGAALQWLGQYAPARLTGTGACIFAAFNTEAEASKIAADVPEAWQRFIARGVNVSPTLTALA